MNKKTLLMILDGWGIPEDESFSAIHLAQTPYIDSLYQFYPNATLLTHGMHVGLPDGQMGNSEVGHMNLGAGRIVYQDLAKINLAIENDTLKLEEKLKEAFEYATKHQVNVHFLGLVSDGGVHSHINHLKGLVKAADDYGVQNSFIHAFTDGRDVDPKSGIEHLSNLQEFLNNSNCQLASVIGRYYAMDRDKRWERIKKAYDLLIHGQGTSSEAITKSIQNSYDNDITDEFIEPIVMVKEGEPVATIQEKDVIIFFNFRTDRGRQLTQALSQESFTEYEMQPLDVHYTTLTNYDESFKGIHVVFDKENIKETLGEVLANNNKKQIRIAETEKYPHVTFFFNGGREEPFDGESRILCPSPKVPTYDMQPEMSCHDITASIIPEIQKAEADFICLNFANPDMVGHTGSMEAAIQACEAVDYCTRQIINTAMKSNNTTIV
ncbi:MAG: 2,3-bisphosphoglycerate-independent phosphoglycerate mutase, partial [Flavobacteriaceae bacterium]|nr:2,3-bisphosphoglycerate-independent phosphoglycerate mutase [Flavobacteriaceae bacterium]